MSDYHEEYEEIYLRENEWKKITQNLWSHNNCNYFFCHEVAVSVQRMRDKNI